MAYASPAVYDLAFSFRKFAAEVDYLLATYRQHSSSEPLRRFLELGAGPARHAILLAQTAGAEAYAVDNAPAMVEYATRQAANASASAAVTCLLADMCQPLPDHLHDSADLAAVLLGSVAHCLDNASALACFEHTAACLRPGGLLVVELPHPEEIFAGGYCGLESYGDAWEAESPDGSERVMVEWGREGDEFDAATQVLQRTVGLSLYRGDELVSSVVDVVPQRIFTLQEVDLLGRAAGLAVVAVHGDFDVQVDLGHEEAYRMLVWLQKD